MSSNWNHDEPFTEEELLAIDAIEASYLSPSSSSSSRTPTVRATTSSGGRQIPKIRPNHRQLPRSITCSTPYRRFPLSRCPVPSSFKSLASKLGLPHSRFKFSCSHPSFLNSLRLSS